MEWVKDLNGLPAQIMLLVVFVAAILALTYGMMRIVTKGFVLALQTQEKRIDDLQEELKLVKSESKQERKELNNKIEKLESQNQSEINQKLDLILQKV